MMRNFVPKVILAVVLMLLALHFFVSNVSITRGGSWKSPSFSFTQDQESSSADTIDQKLDEPIGSSPSLVDDLLPPADTSSGDSATSLETTAYPDDIATQTTVVAAAPTITITKPLEESPEQDANDVHPGELDPHENHGDEWKLPCSDLPGADDVVFIIKTGATEVEEKLPVHFNTTLRCYPKSLIFSDFGEDFQGHVIHDAIGNIIDTIRLKHQDFDLWRRLNSKGRQTLDASELSTHDHGNNLGSAGNLNNGGWRLDKFKNVPMVNYTINRYPDTKWFIYTDADTYVVWSNLLKWIAMMDSTKLIYLGSPAMIDEQIFAHGGSGYVISNALMHKAAKAYNKKQAEWDEYAMQHWAGDCVLATLLERIGAPLDWAYPMTQGGDPNVMNFWETIYRKLLWCYPAISYHHIQPSTVASLWHFEQSWLNSSTARPMLHSDLYKQWYLPQLSDEREGWDNLSDDAGDYTTVSDAWSCRDICQSNITCVQWAYTGGSCKTQQSTKIGQANATVHSGWMLDRINAAASELDKCEEGDWILPKPKKGTFWRRQLAHETLDEYR